MDTSEVTQRCHEALPAFAIGGVLVQLDVLKRGHIHDTLVSCFDDRGTRRRYVHQRLNCAVFPDSAGMMANIAAVLEHLARRGFAQPITIIPTRVGDSLTTDAAGGVWRTFSFVEQTAVFDLCPDQTYAAEASRYIGRFYTALEDFPTNTLVESIPHFQDLPRRFAALKAAHELDPHARRTEVAREIDALEDWGGRVSAIEKGVELGVIPVRVTHGDLKFNNILFGAGSPRPVCLVDLDTCMAGTLLYDFGDWVRNTTVACAEDEQDLSKVVIRHELFDQIANGWFSEMHGVTAGERELLPSAAAFLAATLAARFLTDYLNGDVYFKVVRNKHNLDRARTQLNLAEKFWVARERFEVALSAA